MIGTRRIASCIAVSVLAALGCGAPGTQESASFEKYGQEFEGNLSPGRGRDQDPAQ